MSAAFGIFYDADKQWKLTSSLHIVFLGFPPKIMLDCEKVALIVLAASLFTTTGDRGFVSTSLPCRIKFSNVEGIQIRLCEPHPAVGVWKTRIANSE